MQRAHANAGFGARPVQRQVGGPAFAHVEARTASESASTLGLVGAAAAQVTGDAAGNVAELGAVRIDDVRVWLALPRNAALRVGKGNAHVLLRALDEEDKGGHRVLTGAVEATAASLVARLRQLQEGHEPHLALRLRQMAGEAMEVDYRDGITPLQAFHVALELARWWKAKTTRLSTTEPPRLSGAEGVGM